MLPRAPDALRALAKRRLPHMLFEYIDGCSGTGQTGQWNQEDLRAIRLPQRVMRDFSDVTLQSSFFGVPSTLPLALGPVGMAGMFARRGEVSAATAAQRAGVPFCLSMMSICSIEELADAGIGPFWFQLYMLKDRGFISDLLGRVKEAGCNALVVTVDLPMPGLRYRDYRSGLVAPGGWHGKLLRAWHAGCRPLWLCDVGLGGRPHTLGNIAPMMRGGKATENVIEWIGRNYDPSVIWKDIDFLRQHWSGPLIIKGVMHAEDARFAVSAGADALIVSNHGGRQLDGAPSTVSVLPSITQELAGAIPVYVDGGAYTGSDVVRYLSQGANAVFLGRAWAFALAAAGEDGVDMLLLRLETEIRLAMAFSGSG